MTDVVLSAHTVSITCARIRECLDTARRDLLWLWDTEGWKLLEDPETGKPYAGWLRFVQGEISTSVSTVYRALTAGRLEAIISPTGEIGQIPERQLRELAPLIDMPDMARAAWEMATRSVPEGISLSRWLGAIVTAFVEVIQTQGLVSLPDGSQSPLTAALTGEVAEIVNRQRQHMLDKTPPLLNERFLTLASAVEAVRALTDQPCRVVVYPWKDGAR